jgi:predicted metal-dependent peptidase
MLITDRAPYFRAGVLQIVPRETPDLGTFASTKNWIMLWDPTKATEWGIEGTAAVIVHELWHLTRDHFSRFSAPLINQDVANIATDCSINPGIVQMGFHLPMKKDENGQLVSTGVFPHTFGLPDDLTAEQYYEKLMKMDVQYAFFDASTGEEIHGARVKVHGCGSCSGRKHPKEPDDGDAEGRSENEQRRTRIIIAKAIQQQGRGSAPSELARWANEALKPPKIRWQDKLARVCRAAVAYRPGSGHSTYTKISRRQAGLGFGPGCPVIPSYRATIPRVTFLIDTSGSMAEATLNLAMSEAQGILAAAGATMDVVVCDAAVHGARKVKSIKEACQMLKGGGGSNFVPAFEEIGRRKPKSDIVIAATDGDIAVPDRPPAGTQVIWLLVQRTYNGGFRKPCEWGTSIEVDS